MINRYVALDIETTGLNPAVDRIIEVGMARVEDGHLEKWNKLSEKDRIKFDKIIKLEASVYDFTTTSDFGPRLLGAIRQNSRAV